MKGLACTVGLILMVALSSVVVVNASRDLPRLTRLTDVVIDLDEVVEAGFFPGANLPAWLEELKPEERLLFGFPGENGRLDAAEALWRLEPGNPAYFAEYAIAYLDRWQRLPDRFAETARKIDPENSYFTYLAAAADARECVKHRPRATRKTKPKPGSKREADPQRWDISNRDAYERVTALWAEASRQEKFETYSYPMMKQRMSLLRHEDWLESIESTVVMSQVPPTSQMHLFRLAAPVAARAMELAEQGDREGLAECIGQGQAMMGRLLESSPFALVEELVIASFAKSLAEAYGAAAGDLGWKEESAKWKAISRQIHDKRERQRERGTWVDGKEVNIDVLAGNRAGSVLETMSRMAKDPPGLVDEDLKPARMMEREVITMLLLLVLWFVMAVSVVLLAAYRFRIPKTARMEAGRALGALGFADWAWILGGGLLLPLVWLFLINRITPWGCMGFGMLEPNLMMMIFHGAGLLLFWWMLPGLLIFWRVRKRGFFMERDPWMAADLVMLSATAAMILLAGFAAHRELAAMLDPFSRNDLHAGILPKRNGFRGVYPFVAIPVLWVIASAIRALCGRGGGQWTGRALARSALIPSFVIGMLALSVLLSWMERSIQYWHGRNTLLGRNVGETAWTRYEYLVAKEHRREIRDIFMSK